MTSRTTFVSRPFSLSPLKSFALGVFLCTVFNCGSIVQVGPGDGSGASASGNAGVESAVYVFATDYASGGRLYLASVNDGASALTDTGVDLLGSSAVVRVSGGLVYVLHDGFSTVSSDNLQIIDPDNQYATLGQYSTGNGTNPHDVLVTGSRAFITLYNPTADAENTDVSGLPGDVIEMDTATGEIVNRFSFYNQLDNDGDRNANADQMVLVGNKLYVALQDLDADTFAANSVGRIGIIDIAAGTVTGSIQLMGRNPVSLALSSDGAKLLVADMATYETGLGGFNTIRPYGGIEVVDLTANIPLGLIDDEDLGGYVERIEAGDGVFYAVVSEFDGSNFTYASKIVAFPEDHVSFGNVVTIDNAGTDIREIAIENGIIWISRRQINVNSGLSEPSIEAFSIEGGLMIGNALVPLAPGMSMVGF